MRSYDFILADICCNAFNEVRELRIDDFLGDTVFDANFIAKEGFLPLSK